MRFSSEVSLVSQLSLSPEGSTVTPWTPPPPTPPSYPACTRHGSRARSRTPLLISVDAFSVALGATIKDNDGELLLLAAAVLLDGFRGRGNSRSPVGAELCTEWSCRALPPVPRSHSRSGGASSSYLSEQAGCTA